MIKLTERQSQVLNCIQHYIDATGFPPTRADIARELGFKSANAAEDHLKALAKKGVIEIVQGTSRGIRLLTDTPAEEEPGLPIVGKVAAGSPILATENIENHISIDPASFYPRADYLLRVQGDSMINAGILEGDLIAVKQSQQAENGQIVVARIDNEVTVKRFYRAKSAIQLVAENPDYAPIEVTSDCDDFALEGRVVGVIRTTLN